MSVSVSVFCYRGFELLEIFERLLIIESVVLILIFGKEVLLLESKKSSTKKCKGDWSKRNKKVAKKQKSEGLDLEKKMGIDINLKSCWSWFWKIQSSKIVHKKFKNHLVLKNAHRHIEKAPMRSIIYELFFDGYAF